MTDNPEPTPLLVVLRQVLERADKILATSNPAPGALIMWNGAVRGQLMKVYGRNAPQVDHFPLIALGTIRPETVRDEFTRRVDHLRRFLDGLENLVDQTRSPMLGKRVFIGHGRSHFWLELKDFISSRLSLPCDEFNLKPAAGLSTSERIESMLAEAGFAFLVMTAEEKLSDGSYQARANVIHEVGLFQARLGSRRAIVMLEEGCSEFSNISGLTQIRFPRGDISARFEKVREVLEREGLI